MELGSQIAAVVTGAASGLGEATARLLAGQGAKTAIFDRQADKGQTVAREISLAPVPVSEERPVPAPELKPIARGDLFDEAIAPIVSLAARARAERRPGEACQKSQREYLPSMVRVTHRFSPMNAASGWLTLPCKRPHAEQRETSSGFKILVLIIPKTRNLNLEF